MENQEFVCVCGRKFNTANSLRSHRGHCRQYTKPENKSKYIVEDGKYVCECGRSFYGSQSLLGHFSHCKQHLGITDEELLERNRIQSLSNKHNFANISRNELIEYNKRSNESRVRNIRIGKTIPNFLGKHHSDETKEKIRKSRVKVLSDGVVHPGFDKNKLTYIERWFINEVILKNKLHCKYDIVNEMRIYPYFLDFAFSDIKLDVELDGDYHNTDDRKKRDKIRTNRLSELGWTTYRITAREIKMSPEKTISNFITYINGINPNKEFGCMVYRLDYEHILEKERYSS